jgi:hypothetical protein
MSDLQLLLEQYIKSTGFDGTLALYMADLQNGQEIHFVINQGESLSAIPDIAFSASSTVKIPILTSFFIQRGDVTLDEAMNSIIVNMIKKSENPPADELMSELDPNTGPLVVSQHMKTLGLDNTFIAGFFEPGSPLLQRFDTPANQRTDIYTDPDPYNQTTASDMGMLMVDIYQCAENGGGALVAAFPDKMNQDVCQRIIDYLLEDKLGALIQAGVPEGTQVAHKHGWVTDLNGVDHDWSDVAIVYSPGGNFVLSIYTYHPIQLIWDTFNNRIGMNQLFANIAQTIYSFYNIPTQ